MNDERTDLARKLRSLYWEGNPPPEDEAFEAWLYIADEVREMVQEAILATNVKDAVTGLHGNSDPGEGAAHGR